MGKAIKTTIIKEIILQSNCIIPYFHLQDHRLKTEFATTYIKNKKSKRQIDISYVFMAINNHLCLNTKEIIYY